MRSIQLFLTITALLLQQVSAGYLGRCADDCIDNLDLPNCERDDFSDGWDCVCTDQSALDSVNNCISSSCSSSDQNSIFGNIAQACANRGNPITAAAAEATFSATSGGTLFASGWGADYNDCGIGRGGRGRERGGCDGRAGRCSWTTFTGNWGPSWLVSWSGFDNCSTTTGSSLTAATSPSSVSATTTTSPSPSLGATVITTINGQTLTGTIFSAPANVVSGSTGTAAGAQQTGQAGRHQPFGALGALVFSLVAAISMF